MLKKFSATESLLYKGVATFSSGGKTTDCSIQLSVNLQETRSASRTVARKSSIGGVYVCAGELCVRAGGGLTFKFDKNSTNI